MCRTTTADYAPPQHVAPLQQQQSFEVTPPTSPLHYKAEHNHTLPSFSFDFAPLSPSASTSSSDGKSSSSSSPIYNYNKAADYGAATSAPGVRILGAFAGLVGVPLLLYQSLPAPTVTGNLMMIKNVWDGLLRMSSTPIFLIALVTAVYFGPCCMAQCGCPCNHEYGPDSTHETANAKAGCVDKGRWSRRLARCTGMSPSKSSRFLRAARAFFLTTDGLAIACFLAICLPHSILGSLPIVAPSWGWYPFSWFGGYQVYPTSELAPALKGLCLDQQVSEIRLPKQSWGAPSLGSFRGSSASAMGAEELRHLPLCLTEDSWDTLSAGALSSTKAHDVRQVLKGIRYAQGDNAGMVIAVLIRDVIHNLPNFRENVESLKPFFPKLAVVIFENDSTDGSREATREWARDADTTDIGYSVELMECAEAKDCKFGKSHRDRSGEGGWARTSAIGDMDVYRQRVTDYIKDSPLYVDHSHMMVLDIDLAVSFSPLGVLHTLGEHPADAVASSGRQLLPGAWGTTSLPYDFSAFRPAATMENHWILSLHERWCQWMPVGDRWRNTCHAISPFLHSEAYRLDRSTSDDGDFYPVESAFNGAVLYPLDRVRKTQASYDAGEDGQRCEHIGFNLSFKGMFVNRKWDMHLDPRRPGGPTGWRAQNIIQYFTGSRIILLMVPFQLLAFLVFVHSVTTLGIHLVYPLMAPILVGGQSIKRILSSHHRKRMRMWNGKTAGEETLFKIV